VAFSIYILLDTLASLLQAVYAVAQEFGFQQLNYKGAGQHEVGWQQVVLPDG
jgi:hypothetical protein